MEHGKMILLLVAAVACTLVRAEVSRQEVMAQTLPGYTIALRAEQLNSTTCRNQLEEFRDAVDRRLVWGLRILDSSGELETGFMYGNNYWLGKRSQCLDSNTRKIAQLSQEIMRNNSRYRKPDEEFPPFDVNFYAAYFLHNSTRQYQSRLDNEDLMILGLCLPISCSANDVAGILETIFYNRTLLAGDLFSADFKLLEVKDLQNDFEWLLSGRSIFIVLFVGLMVALTIAGTMYDVIVYQKRLKAKVQFLECDNNNANDAKNEMDEATTKALKPEARLGKIIMCFSLYTNTKGIFDTNLSEDNVTIIHGLKFYGMAWIIMVHSIYYSYPYVDNRAMSIKMAQTLLAQIISNSTLSVDTFFFLSGFLMTHVHLTHTRKMSAKTLKSNKISLFFFQLFKRFMRFTPTYMMIVALAIVNFSAYSQTSLFKWIEKPDEVCAKYWWRNLLYINNFFGRNTMCLSWSWYVSNDMQFFAFGTFVLLLSTAYFYTSVFIIGFALIASIVLNGYTAYIHNYVPTIDEQFVTLDIYYDLPWLRIGPYIVGMITAYLLLKMKYTLRLSKKMLTICWCMGSFCNCLILFGIVDRQIPLYASVMYAAFSRVLWAAGIGWLVVACTTKNAGVISTFLSYKGWIPMSKLTFCAYLLNPFLLNSIYMYGEATVHTDFTFTGVVFLGTLMTTYMCAYLVSLILEIPYILLLRLYLNQANNKE